MQTRSRRDRWKFSVRIDPLALAVAAAVGSGPTFAMAAETDIEPNLREELIVTATRRDTGVQDIPINISAASGEQLEELQINSLAEFARWVPGLTLVDQGFRDGSPIIVRGLNVSGLSSSETTVANSGGNTVATYYGEIPIYIDLELIDINRVEVLRGPQGTLFGANSLAGAIRYMPKQPDTSQFTTDVHGQVYGISESDDPSYSADIVLNAPIIEDKLAFRGFLGYHDRKGFIDYNFVVHNPGVSNPQPDFNNPADVAANLRQVKDANSVETTSLRLALLWEISDAVDATMSYYLQDRKIDGRQINSQESMAGAPLGLATGEYISAMRVEEPADRKNQIFSLDIVADFGFAELTSATGYTMYDQEGQRDQTDLLLPFGAPYTDFATFTAFTAETDETEIFTQELRLVSQGPGPLDWIGGFFYYDGQSDTTSYEYTPGLGDCNPCRPDFDIGPPVQPNFFPPSVNLIDDVEYFQGTDQNVTEWAVFGEIGYQFTDIWQVTLGGRYFEIDDDFSQTIATPLLEILYAGAPDGQPVLSYAETTGSKQSVSESIFKFNTSVDFTDAQLGYLTISEGYRRGGSNAIQDCASVTPGAVCGTPDQLRYDPDTTTNYELGYKSAWLDHALTFNAALFYIDWEKVQVGERSLIGSLPITVNGNDARSQGVEADFQALVGEHWSFRAGYAYTNAELTEDAPQLGGQSGDRLPGSPEHQGSLLISFFTPIATAFDIQVDYGLTSQSDVYTRLGVDSGCCRDDGEALPGFTLSHAAVSLNGERWTARLFSENLFDKYAETGVRLDQAYVTSIGPTQDFQLRSYFKYMATPRTIGLDFRYKFE